MNETVNTASPQEKIQSPEAKGFFQSQTFWIVIFLSLFLTGCFWVFAPRFVFNYLWKISMLFNGLLMGIRFIAIEPGWIFRFRRALASLALVITIYFFGPYVFSPRPIPVEFDRLVFTNNSTLNRVRLYATWAWASPKITRHWTGTYLHWGSSTFKQKGGSWVEQSERIQ
jgi:hypothetical protein